MIFGITRLKNKNKISLQFDDKNYDSFKLLLL